MRTCWLVLLLSIAAAPAWADHIVVMSDPDHVRELGAALEVALGGRAAVYRTPAPAGALRLDRAAAAQRAAVDMKANAAVWIDDEHGATDVCAVSADGRYFRFAPVPSDDPSPRMFAAIAVSLVDELIVPPEPAAPNVNVNVDVNVSTASDLDDREEDEPPSAARYVVPPPPAPGLAPWERTTIEAGVAAGTFAVALEGSLLVPVSPHWRVGLSLLFGAPFVSSAPFSADSSSQDPVAAATAEVRHTGFGYKHWVAGGFAGVMTALGDGVFVSGARIGHVWEGKYLSTQLALSPTLIVADHGANFFPALWLSLRLGFRL